jgi:chorismate mutase / prephenate dehydratase
MSLAARRRGQHANPAGDNAFYRLSGFRVLREGGVFDTLFKFVPLRSCPLLGWDGFVNVGRHKQVDELSTIEDKNICAHHTCKRSSLASRWWWLQKGPVRMVNYLGPEGTFSHILARKRFGKHAELTPCPTIEAVFDGVLASADALGIVPIENSSGGTVYDSVDLLIRHAGRIFIREELAMDVRIALLGRPGKLISTVYSHFVQIKHHAEWLKERYPQARLRAVTSTALAARKAAASKTAAALASPGAAEVYGLEVLELPVLGRSPNVTHFFTIGSEPPKSRGKGQRTALIAALPNVCGSLYRFLGPFARQQVNLSRIVSRPVPVHPQTYIFFLEIDGAPGAATVARALRLAGALASSMRSLGTYPVGRRFKS